MSVESFDICAAYRYGFNGMERDDEMKGSGNSYDFGARIYDSRLGRWMSTDAFEAKYPYVSPYNYSLNNPIYFTDPDGNEIEVARQGDQSTVQAYLDEQAGSGVFTVKQNGLVKINRKVYRAALKSSNNSDVKKEIIKGMAKAVRIPKTASVYVYEKESEVDVRRNPQKYNSATGATDPVYQRSDGSDGYTISGTGGSEGITTTPAYDNTVIIIVNELAKEGTFKGTEYTTSGEMVIGEQEVETGSSASSVFIHESLDHFYEERNNTESQNKNRPKIDQVKWHNKALQNVKGEKTQKRNANDHQGK